MGCMPSKNAQIKVSPTSLRMLPLEACEAEDRTGFLKARLMDSIKRQDLILFEKTLQQYTITPTGSIGPVEQKKTLFHCIAEYNFAEGMTFALNYISQNFPDQYPLVSNMRDAHGNTPAMTCYMHDAIETLEVLAVMEKTIANEYRGRRASAVSPINESYATNTSSPMTFQSHRPPTIKIGHSNVLSGQSLSTASPKLLPLNGLKDKGDEVLETSTPRLSVQVKSTSSVTREDKIASKLQLVLNELAPKSSVFVDKEFPHDLYSIVGEGYTEENADLYKTLRWARPQDFLKCDGKMIKIFEDIELNIASDSLLAGCDLYSALAALTEYPQKLVKLFTSKEINKHGAYSVKFLVAGVPVEVLLDDFFPCSKDSDLIFSHPSTNELWFLLIEKAFAKLYGSYRDIRDIGVCEAFEMMTRMPTSQYNIKTLGEDQLWEMMTEYDKKNYIVCAGVNENEDIARKNKIFSIVRVCESDKHKVIKLRNHFQDFEWRGEFSNGSVKWTKDLKEQAGHYNGEKNYFYMELKELVKHFDFISVCHYHDNWIRNSVEVNTGPNKAVFFEIETEKEMEVYLSVHQKLSRFLDDCPNYAISPVEILVAEVLEGGGLRKVAHGEKQAFAGKSTTYADQKLKIKLSEGKYIVRVKVRWVDQTKHSFVLSTFSPYPILLREAKRKNYNDFLEKVFTNVGSSTVDKYILGNGCEFISGWTGSHLWFYGVNKGTKIWTLQITFNKLGNLKLSKKNKASQDMITFRLPPKQETVSFAKRLSSEPYQLNWSFDQFWD